MPDQLAKAAKEPGCKADHDRPPPKYALAKHRWDEPLATEAALAADTAQHSPAARKSARWFRWKLLQPERAQADDPTGL